MVGDAYHRAVLDGQDQVIGKTRYPHVRWQDARVKAQHIGFTCARVARIERDVAVVAAYQQHVQAGTEGDAVETTCAAAGSSAAQSGAQHVVTVAAREPVIAGTSGESVLAGAATDLVIAAVAGQRVVTVTTVQRVVFAATGEHIVTGLAIKCIGTRTAANAVMARAGQHQVVAAQGIKHFIGVAQHQYVVKLSATLRAARQLVGVPGWVVVELQAVDSAGATRCKKVAQADRVTRLAGTFTLARLADVEQQVQAFAPRQHVGRGNAHHLHSIAGVSRVLVDEGVAAVAACVTVGVAARAALQDVLAGVARQGVVAGVAVELVLPGATAQPIVAAQATQRVVTASAQHRGVVAFAARDVLVVANAWRWWVQRGGRPWHRRRQQGRHRAECGTGPRQRLGGNLGRGPA